MTVAMSTGIPNPVLNVSVDVLKDLDGTEALTSLWSLFTKCQSSLQDGKRLENLSWRLWSQQMAGRTPKYRPLTPDSPSDSAPSKSSLGTMSSKDTRGNFARQPIGKIFCDVLPGSSPKLEMFHSKLRLPRGTTKIELNVTASQAPHLPTPAAELLSISIVPPYQSTTDRAPAILIPTTSPVLSTSGTMSSSRSSTQSQVGNSGMGTSSPSVPFPLVVVVNPTPNPTPHPTPPATPILPATVPTDSIGHTHVQLPPRLSPEPPSRERRPTNFFLAPSSESFRSSEYSPTSGSSSSILLPPSTTSGSFTSTSPHSVTSSTNSNISHLTTSSSTSVHSNDIQTQNATLKPHDARIFFLKRGDEHSSGSSDGLSPVRPAASRSDGHSTGQVYTASGGDISENIGGGHSAQVTRISRQASDAQGSTSGGSWGESDISDRQRTNNGGRPARRGGPNTSGTSDSKSRSRSRGRGIHSHDGLMMASRKKALAGRKNARLGALTNLPGHSVDDQDRATRVQGQSSQSRASSHVGPSASSSGQEQNRTRERAAPSLLGGQQQQLQPMQSQPSQLQPCPTATPAKRAMFNVGSHSPSNTDLSTSSQPRSKSTAPVADLKLAQQPFAKMRSQGGILPVAPLAPAPPPVVPVAPHPPSHPPVNGLPHASANLSAAEAVIHAPRTKKVVLADDEDDDDWDETDTDLDSELEEDPKSFIDAEKGGTLVEKSLAGEGGEDEDWVSEDDKDDSDRSRRAPAPPVVSSTAKKSPRSGVKPTSHRPGPSRHHSQPNIATITSLAKQKSQPQSQLLKQEARQTHAAPHQRTQVAVGGHHRVSRRPEREAQQQQQRQQAAMEQKLRDAALEAQRQRDMFTKVPPRSYSNLGTRSQSGLLSQLMNPDPEIFPDNHPYKRGYSSGDVAVGGRASNGLTRLGIQRLTALTTAAAGNAQMRSNLTSAAPNAALNASRVLPPPRPVQLTELEAGPSTIRRPVNVVGPTTSNAAPSTARKAPNGENVTLEVKPSTTTTTTTTSATSQRSSSVLKAGPSTARISLVNGGSTTGVGRAYSKAPPLRPTKSSAALPVANSVTASSYGGDLSALADRVKGKKREVLSNGSSGGAYRPKGRPLEVEMEDTSGDDTDQGLHISKSVAQEKLAAFADRRISKASSSTTRTLNSAAAAPARPPAPAPAPPVQQPHPDPVPPPQPLRSVSQYVGNAHETIGTPPVQVPLSLAFPYNLPPAAPPSSPRTTRQLMLRTEISESLRQNLLWSRKIHKKEFNGPRRSSSSTLSSALQPLTTFPTVVHLSEKKNKESESAGAGGSGSNGDSVNDRDDNDLPGILRPAALQRNRSWAGGGR